MEKIINRGIIIIVAILILFVFNKIRIASNSHHQTIDHIERQNVSENVKELLNNYLLDHFEYPPDIETILLPADDGGPHHMYWKDPFSKDSSLYSYIPIYERTNKKRMSFIILSAGVDGKIDLLSDGEDSLYHDEFEQKLQLYNPGSLKWRNKHDKVDVKVGFSMIDQLGGKKDLIVAYGDARKYFKKHGDHRLNKDQLNTIMDTDYEMLKGISLTLADIEYDIDSDTVHTEYNGYIIKLKMCDKLDKMQEAAIVAKYHSFDSLSNSILFTNGLVIN